MRHFDRRIVLLTLLLAIIFTTLSGTPLSNAAVISFPGSRPFKLFVPTSYNKIKPAPLILALHGYWSSGSKLEKYLNFTAVAQARGILYVHPDGSAAKGGIQFWNATPECCDFAVKKVNDDAYLMRIIDEVENKYNVDTKRIYVIGHSNGGFMANHMACKHADRIAAIVSIAGATYESPALCKPTSPISVLQIWGTSDVTYKHNSILGKPIPGAVRTTASWARLDHCSKRVIQLPVRLDLDRKLKGKESTISQYQGCPAGTDVELWTIVGGHHMPDISSSFTAKIVDFLMAHPKVSK